MTQLAHCRSCDAPILWVVTTNGKRMPIDVDPISAGRGFRLVDRDGALADPDEAEPGQELQAAFTTTPDAGEKLYVSHYATCPDAAQWRR